MPIQYEHTITVPQSPEQVFALMDDLPRTAEWLGPCTSLKNLTPGENNVGSSLEYRYKEGGREGSMDGEITERNPNQSLVCRYWDKMFEVIVDQRVARFDSGSKVTNIITMNPRSFFAKLLSPMIRKSIPKQTIDAMESFRTLLPSPNPSVVGQ